MRSVSEVPESVLATIIAKRYPGQLLLTVTQVGPLICRSRSQVHRMATDGNLPIVTVGAQRMVSVRALIEWIEALESRA